MDSWAELSRAYIPHGKLLFQPLCVYMEEYVFSTLCGIGLNYIAPLEASVPFGEVDIESRLADTF